MGSKPTMDINTFTKSEKLLLLIGNKIIDATDFCHKHPGGEQALLDNEKTDISHHLQFHSSYAQKKMLSMHIANLEQ